MGVPDPGDFLRMQNALMMNACIRSIFWYGLETIRPSSDATHEPPLVDSEGSDIESDVEGAM
eukprot:NODE_8582_length_404_cov_20.909859_g7703_i0.p2 GENE.NODE_8582_length_404_cov_20.909859_g7703_i0~~NODE_8582_length_404_cov_20.909859_g7703_i0.p2  ORF type:complete len:62 (-),score=16.22 NODE_8582_length_404_cov_20.909859_g7703_i0:186-371(-)